MMNDNGSSVRLFKKIPQKKVSEQVFDQIKSLIITCKLKPGNKMPSERQLIETLQVSRNSIREAIKKLEILGYVEQRQGEGTFVKSVVEGPLTNIISDLFENDSIVFNLMEIREVFESWAAGAAAQRASDKEIQQMVSCIQDMNKAKRKNVISYELNLRLHSLISVATRNTLMIHIMNTFSGWFEQVTREILTDLYDNQQIYETLLLQHAAIVDAIQKRDSDEASRKMLEHLRYAESKLKDSQSKQQNQ